MVVKAGSIGFSATKMEASFIQPLPLAEMKTLGKAQMEKMNIDTASLTGRSAIYLI